MDEVATIFMPSISPADPSATGQRVGMGQPGEAVLGRRILATGCPAPSPHNGAPPSHPLVPPRVKTRCSKCSITRPCPSRKTQNGTAVESAMSQLSHLADFMRERRTMRQAGGVPNVPFPAGSSRKMAKMGQVAYVSNVPIRKISVGKSRKWDILV